MSTQVAPLTIGVGGPELDLSPAELRAIVEEALLDIGPDTRVLAIISDKTRDDNTDVLFPFAAEILAARNVAQFDALVAQGTHMDPDSGICISTQGPATPRTRRFRDQGSEGRRHKAEIRDRTTQRPTGL